MLRAPTGEPTRRLHVRRGFPYRPSGLSQYETDVAGGPPEVERPICNEVGGDDYISIRRMSLTALHNAVEYRGPRAVAHLGLEPADNATLGAATRIPSMVRPYCTCACDSWISGVPRRDAVLALVMPPLQLARVSIEHRYPPVMSNLVGH